MAEGEKIWAPLVHGVALQSLPNQKVSGLFFKIAEDPGQIAVTMPDDQLSRLAALVLNRAAEVAATTTPENPVEGRPITATPIPATSIGVGRGRESTEALLICRFGNLELTFSVDAAMLHGTCTDFLTKVVPAGKRQTQ